MNCGRREFFARAVRPDTLRGLLQALRPADVSDELDPEDVSIPPTPQTLDQAGAALRTGGQRAQTARELLSSAGRRARTAPARGEDAP